MANFEERAKAVRNARLNPFEPSFAPPTGTTLAEVEGAVKFRWRLQSAMEDIAHEILTAAAGLPQPPESGIEHDKVIWSRKLLAGELASDLLALRLVLAEFDAIALADLATVTDQQMRTFLVTIVPILAENIRA